MTARRVAAQVLTNARTAKAWASELIDDQLALSPLSPLDRRLTMQLVFGVMRRRATLDSLLQPFIHRPFHAIEPSIVDILRLGAYQLAFMNQIPNHAAVFETVNLAHMSAKGLVNGVLRRVSEVLSDDRLSAPAANALPMEANDYRRLNQPILPDPATHADLYLAAGFSWPRWLSRRWLERYDFAECVRLGFWFLATPPLWLRVNRLKLDREAYGLILQSLGIEAIPGAHPQSLKVPEAGPIRDLPGYANGEFSVQDLSSMAVAQALDPRPGWRVLDLCAAPGGKTTHLAELMENRGEIVACDIDSRRLDTVTALCQRLGITCVKPMLLARNQTELPAGPYDAALVDVPCSNTGVLGRRPEVRWRLKPDEFEDLILLQTRLLLTAIDQVRPGGVIVYSTCSIEPDENQGVLQAVRQAIRNLILEAEMPASPGSPADGGYWARLRKPK